MRRSFSPTPRRVTTSRERAGGQQDIITSTNQSLQMNEIQGLSEPIVTWLLRCWDTGANNMSLDSRKAHQLGSIARDPVIDRHISTCRNGAFTLWKQMLLTGREKISLQRRSDA